MQSSLPHRHPSELPDELLLHGDEEVATSLVLRTLATARAAERRFDDPLDTEALHDFRVAVRRLRSLLKAWEPQLSTAVRAKDRRSFRKIHRASGAGREAEVTLLWLAEQEQHLAPSELPGLTWLSARFQKRRKQCSEDLNAWVRASFLKRADSLEERLLRALPEAQSRASVPFAERLADHLEALAQELEDILGLVAKVDDAAMLHSARIVGKRLRYLLDPLRGHVPQTRAVVKQSKKIQDILGDLNDVHVLTQEIQASFRPAMAKREKRLRRALREGELARARAEASAQESPGFLALYERLETRRKELLDALEEARQSGELNRWVEMTRQLAEELRATNASPQ